MAELEEEVFEEEEIEDVLSNARLQKAKSRVRWGIKCPYIGTAFPSFVKAVELLRDFGWSDKEILALAGTEEAIDLLERGVLR